MGSNNWNVSAISVVVAAIVGLGSMFFVGQERTIRLDEKIVGLQNDIEALHKSLVDVEGRELEGRKRLFDHVKDFNDNLSRRIETEVTRVGVGQRQVEERLKWIFDIIFKDGRTHDALIYETAKQTHDNRGHIEILMQPNRPPSVTPIASR